jgi:hypothetical protein
MAFFKTIVFAALIAAAAAQLPALSGLPTDQLTNATSGVGAPDLPVGGELPVGGDQLGNATSGIGGDQLPVEGLPVGGDQLPVEGLPVGGDQLPVEGLPVGGGEAATTEAPSRLINSINRLTNGLNGMRGRRHH